MFVRFAAIAAFFLVASAAQAVAVRYWSAVGTACVPSGTTVGHYQTAAGASSVRHLGNETGTLVFTCGLQRFNTANTAWVLKLTYRDSTAHGTSASVIAKLYRMPVDGFTPVLIATLSSNSFSDTINVSHNSINSFDHPFDFDTNAYFVQVTLTRAAGGEVVQFHAVALEAK